MGQKYHIGSEHHIIVESANAVGGWKPWWVCCSSHFCKFVYVSGKDSRTYMLLHITSEGHIAGFSYLCISLANLNLSINKLVLCPRVKDSRRQWAILLFSHHLSSLPVFPRKQFMWNKHVQRTQDPHKRAPSILFVNSCHVVAASCQHVMMIYALATICLAYLWLAFNPA